MYVGIPNLEKCRWNITGSQHNIRMTKWVRGAARGSYCWVPESESGVREPDHNIMDIKCRLCKPEGQFKIRYNNKKAEDSRIWYNVDKNHQSWLETPCSLPYKVDPQGRPTLSLDKTRLVHVKKGFRTKGRLCRWLRPIF